MAILKVAQLGHPVLRIKAEDVPAEVISSEAFQEFIDDMIETMEEYDGAGLAAPQVHEPIKVVVVGTSGNPRYPDAPDVPFLVLVNPVLKSFSDEMEEDFEACLSLDNLIGKVSRAKSVTVEALDRHGEPTTINAEGFEARVFQHEIDHLYGKVFIDRITDMKELYFRSEFQRYGSVTASLSDAKRESE